MEVYCRVYLHFKNAEIENVCICLDPYFFRIFHVLQLLCSWALYEIYKSLKQVTNTTHHLHISNLSEEGLL